MATRGDHLVRGDRGFATGEGWLGRLATPFFTRIVDQLDRRLLTGGIEATLPDGSHRKVGFKAPGPVAVVHLKSWRALVRLAMTGSVGWYKAWEAGEWSSPDPVPLFALFMENAVSLGDTARAKGPMRWINAAAHRLRDNHLWQARENIAAHYDLGNDFYAAWLDETMSYSSAIFADDDRLEVAQQRKIDALLDRLEIKEGTRLLEIGCGWGNLAIAAARRGAKVTGLTLSSEQKQFADEKIVREQLSDRFLIELADYREIAGQFDAIASVEMVEAVGQSYWPAYMDCLQRNLRPGGRAALQYISIRPDLFEAYAASPDFIQTYIFPGGMLIDEPSFETLAGARGLSWQDRQGFGLDYAETLMRWRRRYDEAVARGDLSDFSNRFHDLWRYYLMYCEGGFRGRGIDVAQVTLLKS